MYREGIPGRIGSETHRKNVHDLYESVAPIYDPEFEGKAEYQIPKILQGIYAKYGICNGMILDIGCGTGKIKEVLGNSFSYTGIELSPAMAQEATKRGYRVLTGPAEELLAQQEDKSADHSIATSSLYFLEDFEHIISELERVSKHSIFVSLEQFDEATIDHMRAKGINLYNHNPSLVKNPTEVSKNTFLWKRPGTGDKIFGYTVFKLLT